MAAKKRTSRRSSRRSRGAGRRHGDTRPKVRSITVVGRRWRDRVYGNTYHTADIYGKLVHKVPFSYGGDSMYEQNAVEWLIENGFLKAKKYPSGGYPTLWRLAEDHGFQKESRVTDVSRKRDL